MVSRIKKNKTGIPASCGEECALTLELVVVFGKRDKSLYDQLGQEDSNP